MFKNIPKLLRLIIVLSLLGCVGIARQIPVREPLHTRPRAWDHIKHVVIIPLENGNPNKAFKQPYLNDLVRRGAYFSNYHAITHPSQPNYIAMIAGSTLGVHSDLNERLHETNIGDLLENAQKTWRVYAEDYPGDCFLGAFNGLYARKHVPFLSFSSTQDSPERCSNVVPATGFFFDLGRGQLPTYSMYIPNLDNDGHNTGVNFAGDWLKSTFGSILDNPDLLKDTLFIITYDEDDLLHFNRIYTVFLGAGIKPGTYTDHYYDHYSLLRTIEEIFSLGNLGRYDAQAETIGDIWQE